MCLLLWLNLVHGASDDEELLREGIDAFNRGDLIAAMASFEKAANAGSAAAQARLAWILDQAEENVKAVELYSASAAQGHADGQFGLAEMYENGEGVDVDKERALDLYRLAAQQKHIRAMRKIALAYKSGDLGLTPNEEEAADWERRVASAERDSGQVSER